MKNSIVFIFLLFSWVSLYSQNDEYIRMDSTIDIKQKLSEHSESTNSIHSSFVQEKHLWMLNEVIISKGIFLFKKENNVRWQYDSPIEYTIIIHNGKFTIVSNNKVSEFDIDSNPMFREINTMIVTAIRGDFIDNPDFKSEFLENNTRYLARLVPVKEQVSSILTSIEIYFDKQNMNVEKVIFNEPGDDFTSIIFTEKKINEAIPDSRFQVH